MQPRLGLRLNRIPRLVPALGLDFRSGIDPRLAFSRSSSGGCFTSDGRYGTVPVDTPRIDHDPETGRALGLLLEEQRTNLLSHSADLTQPVWVKTGMAITPGAGIAPDGTAAAQLITGTSGHYADQQFAVAADTQSYAYSLHLKPVTATTIRLRAFVGAVATDVFLSVAAGVMTVASGGGSLRRLADGWYRYSGVVGNDGTGGSLLLRIYPNAGAGTLSTLVWGAQVEAGLFATSHIPTGGGQVTRAADACSIPVTEFPFSAAAGTLLVEGAVLDVGNRNATWAVFNDGTGVNFIELRLPFSGGPAAAVGYVYRQGAEQAALVIGNGLAVGTRYRLGIGFSAGGATAVRDGGPPVQDASVQLPTVGTLHLGAFLPGVMMMNGHLRRLSYFPRRLPDAALRALTAS